MTPGAAKSMLQRTEASIRKLKARIAPLQEQLAVDEDLARQLRKIAGVPEPVAEASPRQLSEEIGEGLHRLGPEIVLPATKPNQGRGTIEEQERSGRRVLVEDAG